MRFAYFCDPLGDERQEVELLEFDLQDNNIVDPQVKWIEKAVDLKKCDFDVLFFDYGGMSLGNSMLQWFCNFFIDLANEHPNIFFVMTSRFTAAAMKDALELFGDNKPVNVLLSIDNLIPYLKNA